MRLKLNHAVSAIPSTAGITLPLPPNGTMQNTPLKSGIYRISLWTSRIALLILSLVFFVALIPVPAAAETPLSIDMKLLVVSADGNEPSFAAIKSILDQVGVPYDTLIATQTPLTPQMLSDGVGGGHYQGILLSTGNLGYNNPTTGWGSAFSAAQWQTLWNYEASFRVRQATLYTYPGGLPDTYGLNLYTGVDTTSGPLQTTLSPAGKLVFNYLAPANPVTIKNAWTYLATPLSSTNPVPLLTTANGYAIASIYTAPDGRQNLTITADSNPDLLHALSLGYGIINWVSKGFFLGERKVYLNAQVDDLLIDDDMWDTVSLSDQTGLTFRMTGADYGSVVAWQNNLNNNTPNAGNVRLEMAFNGEGASGIYSPDTLTPATALDQNGTFKWVSHTYTHANLDDITYSAALNELKLNHKVAVNQLKFGTYVKDSMVQPDVSGLNNPEFLRAAKDFGMRYLVSDTSHPEWTNPSPNAGFYSTYQPSILIIPRRPANLYYNVSTPNEWISEYNYFYAPGGLFPAWDRALTYPEVLDKESEVWLRYLLKYDMDPIMFHQTNLRAYDGVHSLLGDLIDATMVKYNKLFKLPIRSQSEHNTGLLMAKRMAYNTSGVSGQLVLGTSNSIKLKTTKAVTVPLTGITYGTVKETYGGQTISSITLGAAGTLTIPGPTW